MLEPRLRLWLSFLNWKTMQLHQIKRKHKNKAARTVGRGGRRGKTSGRGTKGQKARAGRKLRPEIRDIIKKIPKLRGYRFKAIEGNNVVVGLGRIESVFPAGATISPKTLLEKGIISKKAGRIPLVKILGNGSVTKKFVIEKCLLSQSSKLAIEKAGGQIVSQA